MPMTLYAFITRSVLLFLFFHTLMGSNSNSNTQENEFDAFVTILPLMTNVEDVRDMKSSRNSERERCRTLRQRRLRIYYSHSRCYAT